MDEFNLFSVQLTKNKNMPDWKYTIQKEKSLYFILQISHNKKICLIRLKTFDLHKLYDIYGKNFSSSQVCMQVTRRISENK